MSKRIETKDEIQSQHVAFFQILQAVFSQSTDVTRTKMSLQIVVAGLYPPKDTAMEWNHELNWQPIEIAAEPLQDVSSSKVRAIVTLIRNKMKIYHFYNTNKIIIQVFFTYQHIPILKPCPRVDEAVKEVNESPEVKAILEENKEMTQKLTNLTGSPIKTTCDVHLIYDTLLTESEFGLKLPQWSQEFYPHKLRNLAELCYIHIVYTNELKQLKAGPFIQKMLTEFQQKRNGTLIDLQISLYSAHDVTVVNILSALNMWKQQLPGPAIMTVFELVRDKETQEIGVEIYLRTNATSGAIPLTVPNCGHFCPLDKFILIASKVIPKDHDALCQSKNSHLID